MPNTLSFCRSLRTVAAGRRTLKAGTKAELEELAGGVGEGDPPELVNQLGLGPAGDPGLEVFAGVVVLHELVDDERQCELAELVLVEGLAGGEELDGEVAKAMSRTVRLSASRDLDPLLLLA